MSDLISEDQRLLRELEGLLTVMEPGSETLPTVLAALRDALRAERTAAYGVDVGPERYHTSFVHGVGFPEPPPVLTEVFDAFLPPAGSRFGYFDPARPPLLQRNRPLRFTAIGLAEGLQALPAPVDEAGAPWERLGLTQEEWAQARTQLSVHAMRLYQRLGLEHMAQLRVLVCEGDTMLGWVGAFRPEPFTEREQHLLHALTPAIQRRMALDRRLREAGLLGPALGAALEVLGRPAWVVTFGGRVMHTNKAGQARLAQDAQGLTTQVRDCIRSPPGTGPLFSSGPLRTPGLPDHYLVLDPGPPLDPGSRLPVLTQRWGLTAREAQVLEHVVQGETNKAIALHLGCAERTVEVHVTHLLNKAQVESRSALISRFFQS
ncbi:helix-turn-helix transcriptional regulator [Corallococcus llansteffanensis]|uniref:LuxR family transcriptional regulator n=1 Tax=Corallococcus llansteffanensis TaxID=2316731 RepID=A0A3A8P4V8_9BACT|nr:LuxR family transcriptional regulator [Corallococcus llansteffanensis]RKH51353.1 LuxR family transcriptional regulator [Corallococcus llansteffanensis]